MSIAIRVILALGLFGLLGAPWAVELGSAQLRRGYPMPGVLVSAGNQKLHLYCTGQGARAVVFESGLGTDWVAWHRVLPQLATNARVCVYDRAGYGWSEPGPEPRTALLLTSELHTVLDNAGIRPPVLMVGHSFGAYVTRVFAARFPQFLGGVVLVDPADEEEPTLRPSLSRRVHNLLPPSGLGGLWRLCQGERAIPAGLGSLPQAFRNRFMVGSSLQEGLAERGERDALAETESQVRAGVFPPNIPLTIVTAAYIVAPGRSDVPELAVNPGHIELQAKLARMSSRGKQIVATDSGHTVQMDRPDLVIQAVLDMLQGV